MKLHPESVKKRIEDYKSCVVKSSLEVHFLPLIWGIMFEVKNYFSDSQVPEKLMVMLTKLEKDGYSIHHDFVKVLDEFISEINTDE